MPRTVPAGSVAAVGTGCRTSPAGASGRTVGVREGRGRVPSASCLVLRACRTPTTARHPDESQRSAVGDTWSTAGSGRADACGGRLDRCGDCCGPPEGVRLAGRRRLVERPPSGRRRPDGRGCCARRRSSAEDLRSPRRCAAAGSHEEQCRPRRPRRRPSARNRPARDSRRGPSPPSRRPGDRGRGRTASSSRTQCRTSAWAVQVGQRAAQPAERHEHADHVRERVGEAEAGGHQRRVVDQPDDGHGRARRWPPAMTICRKNVVRVSSSA